MTTEPFDANEIIQQMIQRHIQRKHIHEQIQALNPLFYDACEAQNSDRFRLAQATSFITSLKALGPIPATS